MTVASTSELWQQRCSQSAAHISTIPESPLTENCCFRLLFPCYFELAETPSEPQLLEFLASWTFLFRVYEWILFLRPLPRREGNTIQSWKMHLLYHLRAPSKHPMGFLSVLGRWSYCRLTCWFSITVTMYKWKAILCSFTYFNCKNHSSFPHFSGAKFPFL